MAHIKNKVRFYLVLVFAGFLFFFGLRFFVFLSLRRAIENEVVSLNNKKDFSIRLQKLHVNGWLGNIVIDSLKITTKGDSSCSSKGGAQKIIFRGISSWSLLLNKKLKVKSISIHSPYVVIGNGPEFFLKNGDEKESRIKGLHVDKLEIDSASYSTIKNTSCSSSLTANFDFSVNDLMVNNNGKSWNWSVDEARLTALKILLPKNMYWIFARSMRYEAQRQVFTLDSIEVGPSRKRMEFAKRTIYQIDQISALIPQFRIDKFRPSFRDKFRLDMGHATFGFTLNVFRDKRFPEGKPNERVLPMKFIQNLPFEFSVDSTTIAESQIYYEEVPEEGEVSGKLSFDKVKASLSSFSNYNSCVASLVVTSQFMKKGALKVVFTFPSDEKKSSTVKGEFSHFPLPAVNSILQPAGGAKIETGILREMKFDFHYNDLKSAGQLEIQYDNLSIVSLKKDKPGVINKIISFFIKAIVQKDLNKADSKKMRTGTINFEREEGRGLLAFWWKSVLNGIKSVYNLDKIINPNKK